MKTSTRGESPLSAKPCSEGDKCHKCENGILEIPDVQGCSCHISPPCSACVNNPLTCNQCGWEEPEEEEMTPTQEQKDRWKTQAEKYRADYEAAQKRGHTLPSGGRIFNVTHDGRSGSTMVFTGQYEGNVNASELREYLGDGTFGHRGPSLYGGRFTYTKITD